MASPRLPERLAARDAKAAEEQALKRRMRHAMNRHGWRLVSDHVPRPGKDWSFWLVADRDHPSERNQWPTCGIRFLKYEDKFTVLVQSWFEEELAKQCRCSQEDT